MRKGKKGVQRDSCEMGELSSIEHILFSFNNYSKLSIRRLFFITGKGRYIPLLNIYANTGFRKLC